MGTNQWIADAGIRPLAASEKNPHETSREHRFELSKKGAWHVLGVKLTDHRRAAEEMVDRLSDVKSRTAKIPLKD